MDYKSNYDKRKGYVLDLLEKAKKYYVSAKDANKATALEDLITAVKNGTFSIVVVGQFSAGKSTFLNALMGEKYLPSFATETTATINFLRSIKESPTQAPLIKINYKDGKSEQCSEVTLENIEKYVSTKGDNVARKIASVEIFLDSEYLNDGVSLVDSPGLNGLLEGHEQITNEQIDRSHAAIFMFNAKQPGSKSDFEKLKMLTDRCHSVLIVLNQKDLVNPNEESIEEVIKSIKQNYSKYFNTDKLPEIYAISSYQALVARSKRPLDYNGRNNFTSSEKRDLLDDSNIEVFEERLIKYLTQGEKAQKELLSPIEKVRSFLKMSEDDIDVRKQELENKADADELKLKINSLKEELDNIRKTLSNNRANIGSKIGVILRETEIKIKASAAEAKSKCLELVTKQEDLDELKDNAPLFLNRIQARYVSILDEAKSTAEGRYRDLIFQEFNEYASSVDERLNQEQPANGKIPSSSVKIDHSMFDLDENMGDYLAKREELMNQMDNDDNQLDELQLQLIQAERNEQKATRLETMKSRLKQDRQLDLQALGSRPDIEQHSVLEPRKRSGIFGAIQWIFTGSRERNPVSKIITDTSSREKYDDDKKKIEEQYSLELQNLEAQLKAIPESNTAEYRLRITQYERAKKRREDELNDLMESHKKEIERARHKKERKARAYLEGLIDDIERECLETIYKELRNSKERMTSTLLDVLQIELQSAITRKKEELEIREQQLSSSQEEKNKLIEELTNAKKEISSLLIEAGTCEYEINSVQTDKIDIL